MSRDSTPKSSSSALPHCSMSTEAMAQTRGGDEASHLECSTEKGHRGQEDKAEQGVVRKGAMMQGEGPWIQDR